jgi:hypothetical protein
VNRKKKKNPAIRAKRLAVYHENLRRAELREADDRRLGIRERVHPLRSIFGRVAKSKSSGAKIVPGGLPELGKKR